MPARNWVYYEVRDRKGRLRFSSLYKITAEFFARAMIQAHHSAPEIFEVDRFPVEPA